MKNSFIFVDRYKNTCKVPANIWEQFYLSLPENIRNDIISPTLTH